MNAGRYAIESQQVGLLVDLVFVEAAQRDFDDGVKAIFAAAFARIDAVQGIHTGRNVIFRE